MRVLPFSAWIVFALAACAEIPKTGTKPGAQIGEDPVVSVAEITVTDVNKSDADLLRAQLHSIGSVRKVEMKSFNAGTAVYEIEFVGCECELPAKMTRVRAPGLRYQGRVTKLKYSAYDNQPPQLTFVHPEREDVRLIADSEQLIVVQVKDSDLAEVTVNGAAAEHYHGDLYLARIRLQEGSNQIVVWARDRVGNESTARVHVLAVLSPTADSAVWKTIEGKTEIGSTVLVERREIPVDAKGHYKAVIPIPKGQKQIEIIEIDPAGRKAVSVKDISL